MQNRKSWLTAATVATVALAAGVLGAQTFDDSVNQAFSKDSALFTQTSALKASVTAHAAETKQMLAEDQAAFGGGGGGHPGGGFGGGGHPGGGFPGGAPGGHPGGNPGGNPGGHPGGNPGGNPGGHPGGNPGDGPHGGPGHDPHPGGGWHPNPGPGHWDGWGHPGWGRDGWGWRDGRWLWSGWAPWAVGSGLACDSYFANAYQQCSDAAWSNNDACKSACDQAGTPDGCYDQCDSETSNAVNSCELSYNSNWNCGFAPVWPPVGVVIRIP